MRRVAAAAGSAVFLVLAPGTLAVSRPVDEAEMTGCAYGGAAGACVESGRLQRSFAGTAPASMNSRLIIG